MKHESHHEIIKLYNSESGYTYTELAEKFLTTRNVIAGILWRHKNPNCKIKGMSHKQYKRKFGKW